MHAGSPFINENYIGDLVRRVNSHNPDLILIGGDLMINGILGGRPIPRDVIATMLGSLKARLGVYAVLGNHDWWNEHGAIATSLKKNGITILDNDAKYFQLTPTFHFWLVGLGDSFTQHTDYAAAVDTIKTDAPRIFFMHDPAALFEVKDKFFMAFAGHLHGGQVFIPGIGALITPGKAPRDWAQGWSKTEMGDLFVSNGIGTSILPIRLNAPPEFVILQLGP